MLSSSTLRQYDSGNYFDPQKHQNDSLELTTQWSTSTPATTWNIFTIITPKDSLGGTFSKSARL